MNFPSVASPHYSSRFIIFENYEILEIKDYQDFEAPNNSIRAIFIVLVLYDRCDSRGNDGFRIIIPIVVLRWRSNSSRYPNISCFHFSALCLNWNIKGLCYRQIHNYKLMWRIIVFNTTLSWNNVNIVWYIHIQLESDIS